MAVLKKWWLISFCFSVYSSYLYTQMGHHLNMSIPLHGWPMWHGLPFALTCNPSKKMHKKQQDADSKGLHYPISKLIIPPWIDFPADIQFNPTSPWFTSWNHGAMFKRPFSSDMDMTWRHDAPWWVLKLCQFSALEQPKLKKRQFRRTAVGTKR